MSTITCQVACVRDGLAAKLPASTLTRIQSAFQRSWSNSPATAATRLDLRDVSSPSTRIPQNTVTNSVSLQSVLSRLLDNTPSGPIGVTDIALLYADELYGHPGVFGIMFDTGHVGLTLEDFVPRQGCAVFLRAIAAARPQPAEYEKEVAFTSIHELGHVFNLWHVQTPASYMATSPAGKLAYPDPALNSPYTFREEHAAFLQQCETSRYVRPGGTPFGDRGVAGLDDRVNTNLPRRMPPVALSIHVEERSFWRFEPVELDIRVSTAQRRHIALPDTLDPGYDDFVIWIEDPRGERRRFRSQRHYCQNLGTVALTRGQPFARDVSLLGSAGGDTFRMPGVHKLWAEWRIAVAAAPLRSNTVEVEIRTARPNDARYRELEAALTFASVARVLRERGVRVSAAAEERLAHVCRRKLASQSGAIEYVWARALLDQRIQRVTPRVRALGRRLLDRCASGLSSRSRRNSRARMMLEELSS